MKLKNSIYIYYGLGFLTSLIALFGCSKEFLDRPPKDTLTDFNFYKTDQQVLASTASLYNIVWFDYNNTAAYGLSDFRAGVGYSPYNDRDNVLFNTTGLSFANGNAWRSFYIVVGQSNLAIQNINKYAGPAVSQQVKKVAIAEARFMRALAYRYLVMNWGDVPIIENNLTILSDTTTAKNTVSSVWRFIVHEMRAAANDLPEIPIQEGRVTKWSAEGMLARFYLNRSGVVDGDRIAQEAPNSRDQVFLDSAMYYADRVITLSGKSLISKLEDPEPYAKLFKFPYDNNHESLFELQWVYSGYGTGNSAPSSFAFTGDIQNGDGYGIDKGASFWMLSQYDGFTMSPGKDSLSMKVAPIDGRLKATFMLPGFAYPEITRRLYSPDGTQNPFIFPNIPSKYDPAKIDKYNSHVNIKKYLIGTPADIAPATSGQQNYPNNTYMMRLAEIYLIYAEAALGPNPFGGGTNDAKVLAYFNKVHERAGLPTFTGTLTIQEIMREKFKEFAMEGMAWYDFVNLWYYDAERAYTLINNQNRSQLYATVDKFPNPTKWWVVVLSGVTPVIPHAFNGNFLLPFPTVELSQAPNLNKAAVDYIIK